MSYPNQKIVTIKKENCSDKDLYAKINIKALQKAMLELKTSAFKLWIYFAKNQPYHTFELSCADCAKWGLKPDAYHAAVKDLINKGYLKNVGGNDYLFEEIGITEKPHIDIGKKPILVYGNTL